MTLKEHLNAKGRARVATRDTDGIVADFELTDKLLEGATAYEYEVVAVTRGWMIDELVARGEEHRIGL